MKERAIKLQQEIAAKEAKQADLLVDLNKSLTLGTLWPDLWDHAKSLNAKVVSNWARGGKIATFHVRLRDKVTNATLDEQSFKHADVPDILKNPVVEHELAEARRGRFC